jgi:hypothetical protein
MRASPSLQSGKFKPFQIVSHSIWMLHGNRLLRVLSWIKDGMNIGFINECKFHLVSKFQTVELDPTENLKW